MSAPLERVLITGGTGFVGSALARLLASEGRDVHVLARATSDRAPLADLPVTWHTGSLEDAESVARAVSAAGAGAGAGAAVVHAAAVISYRTRDRELQRRVNVGGTRTVLDACRRAGTARVVHVSSVVAVGAAPDAESALDEDATWNGAAMRCDYADTKREAEELALAAADELDLVAVLPGAIFGPAPVPSNTTRFLQRIARGALGPACPPGSLSVVGVDDVALGIRAALDRGARGRRYLLTDGNLTHRELFARAAAELGAPGPRLTLPPALWSLAVAGSALVDRVKPLELATPQSLRLLGLHFRFDASRARRELAWSPRPFDEVLRETAVWMAERGLR